MNNRTSTLSLLVRFLCVIAPPCIFLSLQLLFGITPNGVKTWKYVTSGCVVFAWSLGIGYRMLAARLCGIRRLYKRAFVISLSEQAVLLFLASLLLDGGLTLYPFLVACMFYWMIAGVVVTRPPVQPTRSDLTFVTHGFPMLAIAYCFFIIAAWHVLDWQIGY